MAAPSRTPVPATTASRATFRILHRGSHNSHGESPGWITDPLSDLDRIPRQQYFLRTISQAAIDKTAADPTKLFGLLDAVKHSFTADKSLKFDELKALIRAFDGLNPAKVEMTTLPVAAATGQWAGHVVATDAASGVVSRLMNFKPALDLPTPLPANKVNVRIVNGTSTPGAAQVAVNEFTRAGFHVVGTAGDADRTDYKATQVRYAPASSNPATRRRMRSARSTSFLQSPRRTP